MTINELSDFLKSTVPARVEVVLGENDMIQLIDHDEDSECYIKYTGGLDFSLQGVRKGNKTDTKKYKFRNENEMIQVVGGRVLQLLDGERRV